MGNSSYEKSHKKRPYWHIDAKWISGIIFLVFFVTGILFLNISQIISKNNVVDTASSKIEASIEEEISKFFDNKGRPLIQDKEMILGALNLTKNEMDSLNQKAEQSANNAGPSLLSSYSQIFQNPLNFGKNLASFFAYKLEAMMYGRISNALDTANEKVSTLDLKDTNIKDKIMSSIAIPKIYSQKQYERYRNDAIIFLIIASFFLIIAIYFSSGFGRLATPGFLILMSSLPGFFLLLSFDNYLHTSPLNNLLTSDQKIIQILADAILSSFKEQSNSILVVYKYLFFSALVLLVIGIIGIILSKILQPKATTDISPRLK